ncbi:sugar phosphate isomerase/epimerase [Sphingomonas sp. YR710]|uniref:sugar phosphate isomerase/epimerase family protein n=1 Tax=Sphingomonas sp. YR710 TaxID=1882773 RepID=UPI0015A0C36D|nr:sugar phosphate isomerase/epimerase [Sphingomonas sp. YR710]
MRSDDGQVHISRRTALAGGLSAALASTIPGRGSARTRGRLFGPGGHALGISLYMLGDFFTANPEEALEAVAKIGFREVETDLGTTSSADLRRILDRNGLRVPNVLVLPIQIPGRMSLQTDSGVLASAAHALGAEFLTCALFPLPSEDDEKASAAETPGRMIGRALARLTADHWHRTADYLNRRGAEIRRHGLKFAYHNHNAEFARYGNTDGLTILLQNTDPKLVSFEMDVGWVAAAGCDPVAILKANPGRFRLMHVKDLAPGHKPNTVLRTETPEVGAGVIDWPAILPIAAACGVRHFAIEQEPPFTAPPIEAARRSFDYLIKL